MIFPINFNRPKPGFSVNGILVRSGNGIETQGDCNHFRGKCPTLPGIMLLTAHMDSFPDQVNGAVNRNEKCLPSVFKESKFLAHPHFETRVLIFSSP